MYGARCFQKVFCVTSQEYVRRPKVYSCSLLNFVKMKKAYNHWAKTIDFYCLSSAVVKYEVTRIER
jgi:hypothetical protein